MSKVDVARGNGLIVGLFVGFGFALLLLGIILEATVIGDWIMEYGAIAYLSINGSLVMMVGIVLGVLLKTEEEAEE